MVVYNQLTIENRNFICERAKSKSDGVYTIRGIGYRVRNKHVTHFAAQGHILHNFTYFTITVAHYNGREQGQKLLKGISE
jgi:hypothetical protein